MATQIKPAAKYVLIGAVIIGLLFGVKHFVLDAPKNVGKSKTVDKFSLASMAETSSLSAKEHLDLPKLSTPTNKGVKAKLQVMAWNGQIEACYANGGISTSVGSLFDKIGLDLTIVRQDDCSKTMADLIKNANDLKAGTTTEPLFATLMGDGMPGFSVSLRQIIDKLGNDYKVVVVDVLGRSDGEDAFMVPQAWKDNPQAAIGGTVAGVERDGDLNIPIKWCADNKIPMNTNSKVYDPHALNIIPANDYIDAGNKYISGFMTEKLPIVIDGKTTGRDTSVPVMSVASWTPVDVNICTQKGGLVREVSTHEYTAQMPCVLIVCKKWASDNRDLMEKMIAALGQAGDQVRSFPDALKFAADVSASVYGDKDKNGDYWMKYYVGAEQNDVTNHKMKLGGSMAFNLADAANMVGLGDDKIDRYRVTYSTFGSILYSFYPTEMNCWISYGDSIIDKSFLLSVVSNHPELLKGGVLKQEYATTATTKVSSKTYSIQFANASDVILPSSNGALDAIASSATIAGGLKVVIIGHTNRIGDEGKNMDLSNRRALAVYNALLQRKIPENRMEHSGVGSAQPLSGTQDTDPQNRRVEIALSE